MKSVLCNVVDCKTCQSFSTVQPHKVASLQFLWLVETGESLIKLRFNCPTQVLSSPIHNMGLRLAFFGNGGSHLKMTSDAVLKVGLRAL